MTATFQRGEPRQVMVPIALATAAAQGDLIAAVSDLAVPAGSFTWDTDLATTRKAFVAAFVGVSAQDKDAAANVYGNGEAYKLYLRTDAAGVFRYAVAAGTYALFDYVGPKKQTGNLLESQLLEKVTDPAQAVGHVVGLAGTNPGYVEVEVWSKKSPATKGAGAIQVLEFPVDLASVTGSGDVLTNYTPGFAGEILAMDAQVVVAVTTGSKAATFTPKIGSTSVTGGAVALTSANATPVGKVVAGSAVTAANVFAATDTLSIVASSVTAFAEGRINLLLKVRNRG